MVIMENPSFQTEQESDFSIEIKKLIENEKNNPAFGNIDEFTENAYMVIDSYFKGQHLDKLVRHQSEYYNKFVNHQIQSTIPRFNPVVIHSETDYVMEHAQTWLELYMRVEIVK